MPDLSVAKERAALDAPVIAWFALHGALVLALRHPQIATIPSAQRLLGELLAQVEQLLDESGFSMRAELATLCWGHGTPAPALRTPVSELVAQIGNVAREAGVTGSHMIRLGMLVGQLAAAAGAEETARV